MSSAIFTPDKRAWSRGSLVEPLPALRARYGPVVADIVETTRTILQDVLDQPTMQDVKLTLRRIADKPDPELLKKLDSQTWCLLVREAHGAYPEKVREGSGLDLLDGTEVSACAITALARLRSPNGRRQTDPHLVRMVRALIEASSLRPYSRDMASLIADALSACGQKCSDSTIRRLVVEAGKVS